MPSSFALGANPLVLLRDYAEIRVYRAKNRKIGEPKQEMRVRMLTNAEGEPESRVGSREGWN